MLLLLHIAFYEIGQGQEVEGVLVQLFGAVEAQVFEELGLFGQAGMALEVVDQLLLTGMLITLYIFPDEFKSYSDHHRLPFKVEVGVTARRLQPKVLALKHGIPNQLGVIIRPNNEPELQRIQLRRLSNGM